MNQKELITNDERCLRAYHENMHHYKQGFYELIELYSKSLRPFTPLWFFKWIRNPVIANKDIDAMMHPKALPVKKPRKKKTNE